MFNIAYLMFVVRFFYATNNSGVADEPFTHLILGQTLLHPYILKKQTSCEASCLAFSVGDAMPITCL